MDQELINSIQKLIEDGKGDSGRLNHILDSLKMGKILYKSDARYLEQLISKDSKKEVLHKNFEPEKEIKTETPKIISNYKSAGVTVIISIILGAVGFLGIGHFYLRKNGRGIGFLVSGFFLSVLSILILLPIYGTIEGFASQLGVISIALGIPVTYVILYLWQIVDSYNQCKKYNYELSE